jgi:hypothetical protein
MNTLVSALFALLSAMGAGNTAVNAAKFPPRRPLPPSVPAPTVPGAALLTAPCEAVPPQMGPRRGMIVETVNYGRYFVHNRFPYAVRIATTGYPVATTLLPAGAVTHIGDVAEGTGGHVMPSNFFESFTVRPATGGRVVYSGVRNQDWRQIGRSCPRARFLLVIGP